MEAYHRDSLREMRRMEQEGDRQRAEKTKGSLFFTLLIILMFLAAGGFYVKTSHPEWLEQYLNSTAMEETLADWKDEVLSVFNTEKVTDVQETVDQALAEQNEAA